MTPELSLAKPAIIGLGYVGLPLALAFGRIRPTIGFDIQRERIEALQRGYDATGECALGEVRSADGLLLTANVSDLAAAKVYIIAVPTPVNRHNWPDLTPLERALETVGRYLKSRGMW